MPSFAEHRTQFLWAFPFCLAVAPHPQILWNFIKIHEEPELKRNFIKVLELLGEENG
jgi:hypothetical protein